VRTFPQFKVVLLALGLAASDACVASTPGTVYLVVGSDTAIWNAGTTVDVYTRHPHYRQDSFTSSNAPVFQVMSPAWRGQFKDSFGGPIKFTWWMMGGNIYRDADNLNVPVANTMTLRLMKQYHGDAIRAFGDEVSLHYHTFLWSDYNGSGISYWNQTRTFDECRADFDVTLAQYLLEEEVFPVSFRSGWHFMDQDWQSYLDQLVPYCFHDNYGVKVPWYTNSGPIAGVEDWSRGPAAFVPYHPSTNDYQIAGESKGWNVRSVKIQALNQAIVDQVFNAANNGTDQVACFWTHLPESFLTSIAVLNAYISQSALNYPSVPFRYCTAVEAMQRWRGLTNQAAPVLDVLANLTGQSVTLTITSSVPIFQDHPFVCLRDVFQRYTNLSSACVSTGTNTWTVALPLPVNLVAKVGVAVTDQAGNLATRILRYLPDDLYIDNSDPQYREGQGSWISITNASWGTDARVMPLSSNLNALADWFLPLAWSGRYRISVQVPAVPGAATNVFFNILAGNTNLLSVTLPQGIATNQWTFIGSARLDPTVSNHVEMVVSGTNQPQTYAVANVLRVVPAPEVALPALTPGQPIQFFASSLGYVLRFEGLPGTNYVIQRSANVEDGWTTLQTALPSVSGLLEYEDQKPLVGQAFYRILSR
jgi:hypothetical protein